MTRRLILLTALLAVSSMSGPSLAQSRVDGINSSGARASAMSGPGIDGPLHRPGWAPGDDGGLARPSNLPDDIADTIDARCQGQPWRIVSGSGEAGRIVYRCVPPPEG